MRQNWRVEKLGNLGVITSSKRIYKHEYVEEGVPFYRTKEIKELSNGNDITLELFISPGRYYEIKEKFGVPKVGDLLISAVGTIGEIMVVENENEFYFKDGNIVWFKEFNDLYPSFLKFALTAFVDKIRGLAKGAAYSALTIEKLKEYKVSFPPIPEQQRIVAILDEAFVAIAKAKANAEQNLKNARELFESYLQSVFEKKGEDWEEKKLGAIIKYDKEQEIHKGLPYIGLEHIESETGRFLGSKEKQEVKSSTFYFNESHVLYGRLRPYLNKVFLPDFKGHCSTEIFPIKVGDQIIREFLFYWLTTRTTVKKIDTTCTGARMPRANMNEVLNFNFSFPTSKTEQQAIVQKLDALSAETKKLEAVYQKKIDGLEELRKSILQKAFRGELSELGLGGLEDDRIREEGVSEALSS
jgi:type I restriction enzyme S subunit